MATAGRGRGPSAAVGTAPASASASGANTPTATGLASPPNAARQTHSSGFAPPIAVPTNPSFRKFRPLSHFSHPLKPCPPNVPPKTLNFKNLVGAKRAAAQTAPRNPRNPLEMTRLTPSVGSGGRFLPLQSARQFLQPEPWGLVRFIARFLLRRAQTFPFSSSFSSLFSPIPPAANAACCFNEPQVVPPLREMGLDAAYSPKACPP